MELLRCAICLDIFERPRTLPCYHPFCEDCLFLYIRRTGDTTPRCPLCRREFRQEDTSPSSALLRGILDTLQWRCTYDGCDEVTPLSSRSVHRHNCLRRMVQCPRSGCHVRVQRGHLVSHLMGHRYGRSVGGPRRRIGQRRGGVTRAASADF